MEEVYGHDSEECAPWGRQLKASFWKDMELQECWECPSSFADNGIAMSFLTQIPEPLLCVKKKMKVLDLKQASEHSN
ncbi:hypothetical protein TREES_T100006425 [Tupaia chinensis]|uniref:Uncharacterized protein n=1 Tax=Tupaia chinensis TaxID=246437 RepID=L9KVX9_TUPCH|nr:hypothetical protein TREES_T100006425 [Tupaia chinensis]